MATIAELAVSIKARTSSFASGLTSAEKRLSGFTSSVASSAAGLAAFGLAATAAAAAGLAALANSSAENIDAAAKLSDRLGANIQDLRGLQYAASLAGSSNEEMASSLDKMNKNIGEAVGGSKEAAAAFSKLGLSAETLSRQEATKTFRQIADAISALPTPAERAAAAVDIFGKSGQNLSAVLALGSKGLTEQTERFTFLQGSIDRLDAAKVENAKDRISDMGVALAGLGDAIAIRVAPFVTAVAEKLIEMGLNGKTTGDLVTQGFELATSAIAGFADFLSLGIGLWHSLQGVIQRGAESIVGTLVAMAEKVARAISWATGVKVNEENIQSLNAIVKEFGKDANKSFDLANKAFDDFSNNTNAKKVGAFFAEIEKKANDAARETAKAAEEMKKIQQGLEPKLPSFDNDIMLKRMNEFRAPQADNRVEDVVNKTFSGKAQNLADWVERGLEAAKGPLEKFGDELGKLGEAFTLGMLDEKQFDALAKHIQESLGLTGAQGKDLSQGSFKQIDVANVSIEGLDRSREDPKVEKQLKLQSEANNLLKSARDSLKKIELNNGGEPVLN